MDKLAIVRSLVGNQADHDAQQVFHGHHPRKAPVPSGGWPQFGSAVARLQGQTDPRHARFISLCYTCTHGPYNEPGPGFLGSSYAPFRPMGPSRNDMILQGVTVDRLADRRTLLRGFDIHAPRSRFQRRPARHGHLQRAGVRPADIVAPGRRARSVA